MLSAKFETSLQLAISSRYFRLLFWHTGCIGWINFWRQRYDADYFAHIVGFYSVLWCQYY